MKKFRSVLKWCFLSFSILFIIVLIVVHNLDFSISEQQINERLSGLPYQIENYTLSEKGRSIHYVAIGDTSKPKVLFVHGSPGSWDNFIGFFADRDLLNNHRLISVDRPGFGKSESGKPERSLNKQAELIHLVLDNENTSTTTLLVGHSYGGPVIARMAIDYPNDIDGLIFVAASIDPNLEETKWIQKPFHYKFLSWLLPDMLYSTNEEIIALKDELIEMESDWKKIAQPVSIIQGTEDKLVPYENALFGESMLEYSKPTMVIKEINHFIPWEHPGLISEEINRIGKLVN